MEPGKKGHSKKHLISDVRNHKPDAGTTPGNIVVIDANGLPTEDSLTSLASIIGGINIQGGWNATTNVPVLASGVGVAGNGYVVTVAGNTNLDGEADWKVKDIVWFDGVASVWRKIDNTQDIHALGGALHSADTLANLNSKVSDRDLEADATKLDGIDDGATKNTFGEQVKVYFVSDISGNDFTGDGYISNPFATPLTAINAGKTAGYGQIFIVLDMSGSGYGAFTMPDNVSVQMVSLGASFTNATIGDVTLGVDSELFLNNLTLGKIKEGSLWTTESAYVYIEDCYCAGIKKNDGITPATNVSIQTKLANDDGSLETDCKTIKAATGDWEGSIVNGSFVTVFSSGVDLDGEKIVKMANGTASDDGAAFGQIPTSLPPSGAASGELSGTYPSPTVNAGADGSAIHINIDSEIHSIASKATPVDADAFVIEDSENSWGKKELVWLNIKATLKTYFDTLYKKIQPFGFDALGSTSTAYLKHGSIIFLGTTKLGSPTKIYVNAYRVGGTSYSIRIRDITNGLTIAEVTGLTNTVEGIQDLGAISNLPAGQARWELQLLRVGSPVGNIVSSGGLIEW